jgi:hypothetical protein
MKNFIIGLLILLCVYLSFSLWSSKLKVIKLQSDINICEEKWS